MFKFSRTQGWGSTEQLPLETDHSTRYKLYQISAECSQEDGEVEIHD